MKKIIMTTLLLWALIGGRSYPWQSHKENNMPGLSPLAIEVGSGANAVDFGYLPQLVNLPKISISAWIYRDADTVTFADAIASICADYGGWILATTPNREITYYQKATPGNAGEWSSPDNAFSLNTWAHVIVTRDNSSPSNKPIMYINGSPVVVTQDVAQIGANPDETGSHLIIGNTNTIFVPLTIPFHGKLFDVRIYKNYILTPDDAISLYNNGVPDMLAQPRFFTNDATQTGLVFQAFTVKTKRLSEYIDNPLNDSLKVRSAIFFEIGSPVGDLTGRTAP